MKEKLEQQLKEEKISFDYFVKWLERLNPNENQSLLRIITSYVKKSSESITNDFSELRFYYAITTDEHIKRLKEQGYPIIKHDVDEYSVNLLFFGKENDNSRVCDCILPTINMHNHARKIAKESSIYFLEHYDYPFKKGVPYYQLPVIADMVKLENINLFAEEFIDKIGLSKSDFIINKEEYRSKAIELLTNLKIEVAKVNEKDRQELCLNDFFLKNLKNGELTKRQYEILKDLFQKYIDEREEVTLFDYTHQFVKK